MDVGEGEVEEEGEGEGALIAGEGKFPMTQSGVTLTLTPGHLVAPTKSSLNQERGGGLSASGRGDAWVWCLPLFAPRVKFQGESGSVDSHWKHR